MVRQRVTFIQEPGDAVEPSSLEITRDTLRGPDAKAAREERLTFALEELPRDLRDLLTSCHELHLRWVSPFGYKSLSPLWSRASPGLQVFYTPQQDSDVTPRNLCSALREAFGELDCISPNESFTALSNDRFAQSSALQYYTPVESLDHFVKWASHALCSSEAGPSCVARVELLRQAVSLDVSYDTIGHVAKVTALWPHQKRSFLVKSDAKHRTEVGILGPDTSPNAESHELTMSGLLTVLGTDSQPSPTLFSFPSRHLHSEATFSASFLKPTGLHPTLRLNLSSSKPPMEDAYCSAHAYLTLPRTIFADKYQLADELFMRSKNLTALRFISQPVDLEAPDYAVKPWGSALLLELSTPKSGDRGSWTAEVPLHLRYLAPAVGGYDSIEVPYPVVFWACAAEEGTKFPTNPFERVNLGYDGLFGPRTMFWHVDPLPAQGSGRLMNEIKVPVLDLGRSRYINLGTGLLILLGFAWVVFKLLVSTQKRKSSTRRSEIANKKTQ